MKEFWQRQLQAANKPQSSADLQVKLIPALLGYLGYDSTQWQHNFAVEFERLDFLVGRSIEEASFWAITQTPASDLSLYRHKIDHLFRAYPALQAIPHALLTDGYTFHIFRWSAEEQEAVLLDQIEDITQADNLERLSFYLASKEQQESSIDDSDSKLMEHNPAVQRSAAPAPQIRQRKAQTIAIYNNKGGVGKTTIAINLASCLSEKGHKVLLVDFDAQANSTLGLGVYPPATEGRNIASLLQLEQTSEQRARDLLLEKPNGNNIDLLPSSINLYAVLRRFLQHYHAAFSPDFLKNSLAELHTLYDFILIDTPPAMDICYEYALHAADHLLIPSDLKPFSIYGLSQFVEVARQQTNILGVVGNNIDLSFRADNPISEIKEKHNLPVFRQLIHNRNCLAAGAGLGISILQMNRTRRSSASTVALYEFQQLTEQILSAINSPTLEQEQSDEQLFIDELFNLKSASAQFI